MTTVRFFDPSFIPGDRLTYSVITARHMGRWIFVKHRLRKSFEIPGGHIEENETPEEAARRELTEETGARLFDITCVATYSVEKDGITGYGRLFFAEVTEMGEIMDTSEIDQVTFGTELPEELTYPDIQPVLFEEVIRYIQTKLS
jgi:8-oxo-dGTP diphosphatase